MCGQKMFPPEKELDSRASQAYYHWEVIAKIKLVTPEELFKLRTSLKMTQADFGQFVGVTMMTVSRWERGFTKISRPYSLLIRKSVDEHRKQFSLDRRK